MRIFTISGLVAGNVTLKVTTVFVQPSQQLISHLNVSNTNRRLKNSWFTHWLDCVRVWTEGFPAHDRERLVLGPHRQEDPGSQEVRLLWVESHWGTQEEPAGQQGAEAGRQGGGLHRHPQQRLQCEFTLRLIRPHWGLLCDRMVSSGTTSSADTRSQSSVRRVRSCWTMPSGTIMRIITTMMIITDPFSLQQT